MAQKRPTKEELRQAALTLRAAIPKHLIGLGGRPKSSETCPFKGKGCTFRGGYREMRAHIPHCPQNQGPNKKLTVADWNQLQRKARQRQSLLKRAS